MYMKFEKLIIGRLNRICESVIFNFCRANQVDLLNENTPAAERRFEKLCVALIVFTDCISGRKEKHHAG